MLFWPRRPWCADLSSAGDLFLGCGPSSLIRAELVRGNRFSLVHLNSAHLLPLCVAITRVNINFLSLGERGGLMLVAFGVSVIK